MLTMYKYHGAGNDFLIADNRDGNVKLDATKVRALCDRHTGFGADGLMLLVQDPELDFGMEYFNSDGSGGMMCGNGGRCIVAFAADIGYKSFNFKAPDGPHEAYILRSGNPKIVRLKMRDVIDVEKIGENEYFLDTGTKHFVRFVEDIKGYDVIGEGRRIRYDRRFATVGTNADFVRREADRLIVRTYEKGVESETLACGTGIVASAIAAFLDDRTCGYDEEGGILKYVVDAKISSLTVEFRPSGDCRTFEDIWLTGPAEYIGIVKTE